jgi:hypothetical protein
MYRAALLELIRYYRRRNMRSIYILYLARHSLRYRRSLFTLSLASLRVIATYYLLL